MATNWFGSAHESVTNAIANAPSLQAVAENLGIKDFHQWASAKAFDLHSAVHEQAVELVKTKVKGEFGNEVIDMLDALSECMRKISEELKLKEAKFGITLALPLVSMQHNMLERPDVEGLLTDRALLDEAAYWVDFAAGAYGKEDIKGYDKASVNVAIGEKSGVEVTVAYLPAKGVQMPGHFVAVDRNNREVVLGIRGTTTLSDALTDAVGEATQVPGCPGLLAHKAMLASAQAVLEKTRPALEQALRDHSGFSLVITGHSLGAGTAILCTVLLSVTPLKARPRMRCFAYAPPPVIGPLEHRSLRGLVIHSFINRADVVPRASLANVFHLGLEAMAVDGLDLDFQHRFNLMRRDASPENEEENKAKKRIVEAVKECQEARHAKPHESFPPLFVAGQVYWIEWLGQEGSVQDAKNDTAERAPRIHLSSARAFQALLMRGGTNALKDHLCGGYKEGLEGYKNHLKASGGCNCTIA
ncbi:unnamed protein product [Durusdinium trenchii]|uniref:sn-1-specific diacylglycerol lipase n=3 Tax=Durusdinium trenchii TaxID=1381693 RepID=A0ABP0L9S5_9DINO